MYMCACVHVYLGTFLDAQSEVSSFPEVAFLIIVSGSVLLQMTWKLEGAVVQCVFPLTSPPPVVYLSDI